MEIGTHTQKRRHEGQKNGSEDDTGSMGTLENLEISFSVLPFLAEVFLHQLDDTGSGRIRKSIGSAAMQEHHPGLPCRTKARRRGQSDGEAFAGENCCVHHALTGFDDGIQRNPFAGFDQNLRSGGNGSSFCFGIASVLLQKICSLRPDSSGRQCFFWSGRRPIPPADCQDGTES